MKKTEPCKVCGSILIDVEQLPNKKYIAICFSCGHCVPECNTANKAVFLWNKRNKR